jgi:hypothetical protein
MVVLLVEGDAQRGPKRRREVMNQTTTREQKVAGLGRFDRVYSELHGMWVRFLAWEDSCYAQVGDSETCEPLADLVHKSQLR